MTNITIETLTVFDDPEKRIVRVAVTDLEANVPYSQDVTITKTVERRSVKQGETVIRQRLNSKGEPVFLVEATDDDILNKQGALISKAIRTLGLRLIPGDLLDEAMDAVMETLQKRDAQDPDAAKRRLFDSFSTLGVSAEQLKEYLGHKADVLNPKELADLRGLFAALRDGRPPGARSWTPGSLTLTRRNLPNSPPPPSVGPASRTPSKRTPPRRPPLPPRRMYRRVMVLVLRIFRSEGMTQGPGSHRAPTLHGDDHA
jgi:hypothetical protein